MNAQLQKAIEQITGQSPQSKAEGISYLRQYLYRHNLKDIAQQVTDVYSLLTIAASITQGDPDDIVTEQVLHSEVSTYDRIGPRLNCKDNIKHRYVVEPFVKLVKTYFRHFDNVWTKQGVSFVSAESENVAFAVELIRKINNVDTYSARLILPRIHSIETLKKYLPKRYLDKAVWYVCADARRTEGKYLTFEEIVDIITRHQQLLTDHDEY